jgi:hypothetical protein
LLADGVVIAQQVFGPEHPEVVGLKKNYAEFLKACKECRRTPPAAPKKP